MAGQGYRRREFMRIMAVVSVASATGGFHRWVFADDEAQATTHVAIAGKSPYRPQFFTAGEFRLVERITDLIIPADDHPGASEAGVAEFVDFMVANGANLSHGKDSELQGEFRSGLQWMDQRSNALFGKPFLECAETQQQDLLEHLAYSNRFRDGEQAGRQFFQMIRDHTVKGYYTSRIGLESLGYPGLQVAWGEMPGCPHGDDPAHRHLPPPIVRTE